MIPQAHVVGLNGSTFLPLPLQTRGNRNPGEQTAQTIEPCHCFLESFYGQDPAILTGSVVA